MSRKVPDYVRILGWSLQQLQRQIAYDRLLERLYLVDDGWIVKGATALLARDLGMRATIDVDVYRARAAEAAEADLREAVRRDIGDWFRFEVGRWMISIASTLDDALRIVRPCLDPLLDGTAPGTWQPEAAKWEK